MKHFHLNKLYFRGNFYSYETYYSSTVRIITSNKAMLYVKKCNKMHLCLINLCQLNFPIHVSKNFIIRRLFLYMQRTVFLIQLWGDQPLTQYDWSLNRIVLANSLLFYFRNIQINYAYWLFTSNSVGKGYVKY